MLHRFNLCVDVQRSHGCRFSVVPHQSKFHDRCVFVYVSLFKRRVKVCFIIGLSKYIIFSLLDLLMYCLLHWLLIEKFLSSLCKVSFGCLQSINESFDYINASSVFINETFIYKNGTCIYSLNQVRNKFSINEKEVYI